MEYQAICEALDRFDELELKGAVMYVKNRPAGMTVASKINNDIWDIHYEKVIEDMANDGGYAVINRLFAQLLEGATYINREEDMGIEGLRKAKQSYHPMFMVKKYSAIEI